MEGSITDEKWVEKLCNLINAKNVPTAKQFASAHRNTMTVMNNMKNIHESLENKPWRKCVLVTVCLLYTSTSPLDATLASIA